MAQAEAAIAYVEPVKCRWLAAEVDIMWFRFDQPRVNHKAERGATLTGYALTMATMVVVALSTTTLLQDNSEDFLVGTGSEIGDARDSSFDTVGLDYSANAGLPDSTGGGAYTGDPDNPVIDPPDPSITNNFATTASPVAGEDGEFFLVDASGTEFCTHRVLTEFVVQPCPAVGDPAPQFELYNDTNFDYITVGDGLCLRRGGSGDDLEVETLAVLCDDTDEFQQWNVSGGEFSDPHNPDRCLTVDGGISANAKLVSASCTGGNDQLFDFGATPPVPATTSPAGASYSQVNQTGTTATDASSGGNGTIRCMTITTSGDLKGRPCDGSSPVFGEYENPTTGLVKIATSSGECLTMSSDSGNSRRVIVAPCADGTAGQDFEVNATFNGATQYREYPVVDPANPRCLDMNFNDDNQMSTWRDCKGSPHYNQAFKFG